MANHLIITIGREYGSGGREIGRRLASKLGIKFYDKELIELASQESGMSQDAFQKVDEIASGSLLYSIVTGAYSLGTVVDLPLNDKLFILEANIIRKIADTQDCVIVGRCADYILRDDPNCISVFIHGPLTDRVKYAITHYNLAEEKSECKIVKIDKKRATYYNYYTGNKWGNVQNYDLAINSSLLGIDGTVEIIKDFIEKRAK